MSRFWIFHIFLLKTLQMAEVKLIKQMNKQTYPHGVCEHDLEARLGAQESRETLGELKVAFCFC